jgi:hypothetical protein
MVIAQSFCDLSKRKAITHHLFWVSNCTTCCIACKSQWIDHQHQHLLSSKECDQIWPYWLWRRLSPRQRTDGKGRTTDKSIEYKLKYHKKFFSQLLPLLCIKIEVLKFITGWEDDQTWTMWYLKPQFRS